MENIDQLQDRPSGIALCPKEDCLPPGISQYADVASEPRQQLPPPGDIDQPTNTRTFQHDRGARCVCHSIVTTALPRRRCRARLLPVRRRDYGTYVPHLTTALDKCGTAEYRGSRAHNRKTARGQSLVEIMPDRTAHITRAVRDVTVALVKMLRMWLPTVCRLSPS